MSVSEIIPIAFRIEEKGDILEQSISFSAPSFTESPSRTHSDLLSSDSAVHRGKREFRKLVVITYEDSALDHLPEEMSQVGDVSSLEDIASLDGVPFFSGNPRVETTEGIIHVYKDGSSQNANRKSQMLCIFSVPAYMTIRDIMAFTAPMRNAIEQLKIVKDGTPNQYMVLLKFKSQECADEFYTNFNSVPYNSVESEICTIVYVSHVEALPTSGHNASFPLNGLVELPSCPVCLERLDEPLQGVLTILCNHTFHGNCISKMTETTCPVCRYVQTPENVEGSVCSVCELGENLWICLICGNVGCGRYGQKHAHAHFEETGHTFALELGKNMVWDYAEDAYVHRLVANKSDGKLVQVGEDDDESKKLDGITLEMTHLLTSQLESQRHYFEAEIARIESVYQSSLESLQIQTSRQGEEVEALSYQLQTIRKEKQSVDHKLSIATTNLSKALSNLSEERQMNECLRANQVDLQARLESSESAWKREIATKEAQLIDIQEQMRDLMMNLEMRDKIEEVGRAENMSSQDLAQSHIVVTEGATPPPPVDLKQKMKAARKNSRR